MLPATAIAQQIYLTGMLQIQNVVRPVLEQEPDGTALQDNAPARLKDLYGTILLA